MNSQEESLRKRISVEELQQHLVYFSTVDRTSGTPGEREAVAYIQKKMEEYQVPTHLYTFNSYISYPLEAELHILAPETLTIPCRTRAFSASTPAEGIEGEIVFVGSGEQIGGGAMIYSRTGDEKEFQGTNIRGKIALTTSGGPDGLKRAQDHGALAQIHMWHSDEDVLHEMIVTSIWGTPTPESIERLPKIPGISIKHADGQRLKELCSRGTVRARLKAKTWIGWKELPLLVATIEGSEDKEKYLLVGAHIDSWYVGVTDNGTGNACLMEMARVLAQERALLKRGVKFAWWPGHSTGRYSGSTWYADNCWEELRAHCLGYLNIDSPGIRGASVFDSRYNMAEVERFMAQTIREVTGLEPNIRRPFKAGDQSFWGVGLPSLGAFRMIPPHHPDRKAVGGSGGGWWWHTPEDTLDKADAQVLAADTELYTIIAYRMCTLPILPYEFETVAEDFRSLLTELQEAAKEHLDLTSLLQKTEQLKTCAERLERVKEERKTPQAREALNKGMMQVSRILNPVLFTKAGDYEQDPALQQPMLPGLQPIKQLVALDPASDMYGFLRTKLIRERNRVSDRLEQAIHLLGSLCLAE